MSLILFAPFFIGDLPVFSYQNGEISFPGFEKFWGYEQSKRSNANFFNLSIDEMEKGLKIYPLFPYSGHHLDYKNANYRSPFDKQYKDNGEGLGWRNRHWLGTDRLGHDVLVMTLEALYFSALLGLLVLFSVIFLVFVYSTLSFYFDFYQYKIGYKSLIIGLMFSVVLYYGFIVLPTILGYSGNLTAYFLSVVILFVLLSKISVKNGIPVHVFMDKFLLIMDAIPWVLILVLLSFLSSANSLAGLVLILSLGLWIFPALTVRNQIMIIRNKAYVEGAVASGLTVSRIGYNYFWKNLKPTLKNIGALIFLNAVLAEAMLSFLGLGFDLNTSSLGKLMTVAYENPSAYWVYLPALFILLYFSIKISNFRN